jgi:hypothetical protein
MTQPMSIRPPPGENLRMHWGVPRVTYPFFGQRACRGAASRLQRHGDLTKKVTFFFLIFIIIINPLSDPERKRAASAAAPAPTPAPRLKKKKEAKCDRRTIPQYMWETSDGQVVEVPGFCGDEADCPGVPIGMCRTGVGFDTWDECVQDRTLLPW